MTDAPTSVSPVSVAFIGGGLIGSSWAALFAAAGHEVRLHDRDAVAREEAGRKIAAALADLATINPGSVVAAPRVHITGSLEEAVTGAAHVQESIAESVAAKLPVLAAVRAAAPEAVIASSTSTFRPSELFAGLPGRERTLIVHPLLPPHLIPVSELVPAPFTDPQTMDRTAALFASVGHHIVRMQKETPAFVLNRLQFALLGEAFHLVDEGYCSPEDIDIAMVFGLGMRWATIGPFANLHLNAAGGARGSLTVFGPAMAPVLADLKPAHPWSPGFVDAIDGAMRAAVPAEDIPAARARRDAAFVAFRRFVDAQQADRAAAETAPEVAPV